MIYIDMNMVRAGVVKHPAEWPYSGYNEIQAPRGRYALLDYEGLGELLNIKAMDDLAAAYRGWIEDVLVRGDRGRDRRWTESVAVGSETFVKATKDKLGHAGNGRRVIGAEGSYELRESPAPYRTNLGHENDGLRLQNVYSWNGTKGGS
jgi:putative transposase